MKPTEQRLDTIKDHLDRRRLSELFIEELGWDRPPEPARTVTINGVTAIEIADKKGVGVWKIEDIPAGRAVRELDKEISKRTRERLLIFIDGDSQVWMWPEQRPSGSGFRLVRHEYSVGSANQGLIQRLANASFTIEEENTLTVMGVLERVRVSFAADKVTKRFYTEYRTHHEALVELIEGIETLADRNWYGSVLMTRLMFLYFIEKKGFLDNDTNYLRNRLHRVRDVWGSDAFYGFYRDFLLPLFHQGLGSNRHDYDSPEIAELVGDVPYVNGGIFAPHLLETRYADIQVPDKGFEEIFTFFDQYRWHLDERPTSDVNEINPDVLGYIFEQYINQKAQGAYYTKEDVTGYMTGVTIIPAFFDKLDVSGGDPLVLPTVDPDRYIYESVRHGVDNKLPDDIAAGIDNPDKRDRWDAKAQAEWGLPGETWWEVIDRRRYCTDLRSKLAQGEIASINDAITYNLDLRTLAADYLDTLGSLDEVTAAFTTLTDLRILDPTSGSGAFLFAALETLADLYEILIDRARELSGGVPPTFLIEAERHTNTTYYIMKTAILNNLYGVDIMEEAGEISRLRLFLKLVAQIDKRANLEPLPDLDFNIRTGNLLVGIASLEDAKTRLGRYATLFNYQEIGNAARIAEAVGHTYRKFVIAQASTDDPEVIRGLKDTLNSEIAKLRDQLDRILYDLRSETSDFNQWRTSHQPFHWFVEYPEVFTRGGFDVVVGNPPYIGRTKVTDYRWIGYQTQDCPDIYANCIERSSSLISPSGRLGMILPISMQFSDDFTSARDFVSNRLSPIWVSTFSRNPAALFTAGLGVRNSIVVGSMVRDGSHILSSKLNRWVDEYRPVLMENLRYTQVPEDLLAFGWPRLLNRNIADLFVELVSSGTNIGSLLSRQGKFSVRFKSIALYYLSVFLKDPPSYSLSGTPIKHTGVGELRAETAETAAVVMALLASKASLAWWAATSDDFHLTVGGLKSTPTGQVLSASDAPGRLATLGRQIQGALLDHVIYTKYAGKWMGNYDFKYVRNLTDLVDKLILASVNGARFRDDLELSYWTFVKATGERPGTIRVPPSF